MRPTQLDQLQEGTVFRLVTTGTVVADDLADGGRPAGPARPVARRKRKELLVRRLHP
jgi:hypothetical protein